MRIGISLTAKLRGGSVTHLREILNEWIKINEQNEYILFTIPQNLVHLTSFLNIKRYAIFTIPRIFSIFIIKSLWEQIFFPFYLRYKKIVLLFCPGNFCPLFSPVRTVVMLQNAGSFCHSINIKQVGFYRWFKFKVRGLLMKISAKRAEHVIFVSHYLKSHFVRNYRFPAEKGTVIYLGRNIQVAGGLEEKQLVLKEFGIRKPFILFASILYSYKNVSQLIEGFWKAVKLLNNEKLQLVIAGKTVDKKYFSKIMKAVERNSLEERVRFLSQIPQQKLFSLYANCLFFVFTSTCENCPMVLIEAMSSGSPILCSNLSVMPEICRDAALYFNPYDVNDIAEKMLLLIRDAKLREELRQKALNRVKEFPTWEEVAQKTLEVLEKVGKLKS